MTRRGINQKLRAFARREQGSASIEAVLWIPMFLLFFSLLTDTSLIFGRESEILRIVQDANRSLAVGRFQTIKEAQTYVNDKVAKFSPRSIVNVSIDQGIISTTVSLPATDLTITGLLDAFSGVTIAVSASQMSEV